MARFARSQPSMRDKMNLASSSIEPNTYALMLSMNATHSCCVILPSIHPSLIRGAGLNNPQLPVSLMTLPGSMTAMGCCSTTPAALNQPIASSTVRGGETETEAEAPGQAGPSPAPSSAIVLDAQPIGQEGEDEGEDENENEKENDARPMINAQELIVIDGWMDEWMDEEC